MVLESEEAVNVLFRETPDEPRDEKSALGHPQAAVEGNYVEKERDFVSPAVGMEFESYDDAYNYYSYYAREFGFSVRVKNSWFKRNSREKYGAVLCCSSQGFKRVKGVNHIRRETRTGCPAMMRMRMVNSRRWRILEVTLEHNHVLGLKLCRFNKNVGTEAQTVKLYRAVVIDSSENISFRSNQNLGKGSSYIPDQLNLTKGNTQAMYNYLCRMQLVNPNFSYLMDLSDDGRLKNVFWIDARSQAAICYFSDVVFFDNACLSNKYETPLVGFFSVNHHGQSILLGCGLLSNETMHSYTWLFRAWLSCTSGHLPRTIITDRCKILQSAVAEVFPNSKHRFCLSRIMRKIPEKLGGLPNYEVLRKTLLKAVYETLKPVEFEAAWGFMIQNFGVADNEWLGSLYDERSLWVPVYQRDIFFMGMDGALPGETANTFFDKFLHKQTSLKEFLDKYELSVYKNHNEEVIADMESRNSSPELKTKSPFEIQLSKVYTREIFRRFQLEIEEMYSCLCTKVQIENRPYTIFLVKERVGNYEVLFNGGAGEVRCICKCFNLYGYLCRHALCVLDFNGVEEVPSKYILPQWNKDYKGLHDSTKDDTETADEIQRFNQLYRSAVQIVEEGAVSLEHYEIALKSLESSVNVVSI